MRPSLWSTDTEYQEEVQQRLLNEDAQPTRLSDRSLSEADLYRIRSPRSKRRQSERYPPRFEPYYTWGVGWFDDTRYVDKAKGFGADFLLLVTIAVIFGIIIDLFGG